MYFDLKEPDAEIYVNKVSSFELEGIEKLRHAKLIAMVKDSNRQYTDAAERYYKLAITQEKFPDEKAHALSVAPNARFGSPEEIANVILFALSKDASFITGADLMVDGALHARYA